MMRVKKFGNWDKLTYPIIACEHILTEELKKRVNDLADEYLNLVSDNIKSGKYTGEMVALDPITVNKKGGNSTPWYDTGTFADKLKKVSSKSGGKFKVMAGALEDVTHHTTSSGEAVSMYQVAIWNEFGTVTQPGRPIFGLTFEEMEKRIKEETDDIQSEIKSAWSVL
jgi:hypothetical protein